MHTSQIWVKVFQLNCQTGFTCSELAEQFSGQDYQNSFRFRHYKLYSSNPLQITKCGEAVVLIWTCNR